MTKNALVPESYLALFDLLFVIYVIEDPRVGSFVKICEYLWENFPSEIVKLSFSESYGN